MTESKLIRKRSLNTKNNKVYTGLEPVSEFFTYPPLHKQAIKAVEPQNRKQSFEIQRLKRDAGLE